MKQLVKFSNQDQAQFFSTLRRRVNDYFEQNNLKPTATPAMVFKTVFMFSLYLIPYFLIISNLLPLWGMWLMTVLMGFGAAGIGFSVMHDANHGAYTRNPKVNDFLGGLCMNLVGGSSFTWKIQHNFLHHTYTNIYTLDEDIEDKPILRFSPYGKWAKIYRYQHIYAFFLYMLSTVGWILRKDFIQLAEYNRKGLTQHLGYNPKREAVILVISKLFYLGYLLVIPMVLLNISFGQWLVGFLTLHAILGLLISVVFQLAHVVEGPSHHEADESGMMENTWAIHQLETTADFARNSRLLGWFIGGLNFQVEHHLFPKICHVHYKAISEIVQSTAQEFNLPYYSQKSFFSALASHIRVLKRFGSQREAAAVA